MIGSRDHSNLKFYGRIGIAPLLIGFWILILSVLALRTLPEGANAWLVFTLSLTMALCGLGAVVYGFWLDWRSQRQDGGEGGG